MAQKLRQRNIRKPKDSQKPILSVLAERMTHLGRSVGIRRQSDLEFCFGRNDRRSIILDEILIHFRCPTRTMTTLVRSLSISLVFYCHPTVLHGTLLPCHRKWRQQVAELLRVMAGGVANTTTRDSDFVRQAFPVTSSCLSVTIAPVQIVNERISGMRCR